MNGKATTDYEKLFHITATTALTQKKIEIKIKSLK